MLSMEATARTYRYLDAAEVEQNKKAAAEKAAKKPGAAK
jgi:type IV pilus assembly protein PilO